MTKKEFKKQGQVKQVIKKLFSRNAETYLKWKIQLDHVLKNRPCESGKENLDMTEVILNGDLLKSWKLWRKTKFEKEIEGTFQKKDTGETYRGKYKKWDSDEVLKYYLSKVC